MAPAEIVSIFVAVVALAGTILSALLSARASELRDLRSDVESLKEQNGNLQRENIHLREYIALLRNILREHDIDVPALSECAD